jgi:glycine/D-amino acid oxidase-like deaminating enzyme/nitrite reductase/ring-hydroxylating ferredoxin subunit
MDGRHESFWLAGAERPHYPRMPGDLAVDVAVIGGGIAGVTAAVLLRAAGKRVALVEARRIGGGVTGHTTAHLTLALDTRYHELARTFGAEGARLAAHSQRAAIDRIERFVADRAIDCDFARVPGWLWAEDDEGVADVREEAEALHRLGIPATLSADVPLPHPTAVGLRFDGQGRFHVRKYLDALVGAIPGDGSYVFEHTRVLDVHDGEPCRVDTDAGRIEAREVIVATHTPVNTRVFFHTKVHAYRSYVIAARLAKPPPDALFWDTADPYHYVRLQPAPGGPLVLFGGEDHRTGEVEDTLRPFARLERWAADRYPIESIDYRWSAQVYEPVDGLPFVGRSSLAGHVWVATGFSGNGMTHGTMAAMLLADEILGVGNPWASLYEATRVKTIAQPPVARKYATENVSYPSHLVLDRLRPSEAGGVDEVLPGEGRIVSRAGQKIAVYRDDAGRVHAVSPVCTHLGCHVRWNRAERSWDCPCHGSRYDPDGGVLDGPASKPLPGRDV